MMKMTNLVRMFAAGALALLPSLAWAQPPGSAPSGSGQLPPPRDSHDVPPPVPTPVITTAGVTEQAGIGGTQAYARAGVLELGGAIGFNLASDFKQVAVGPRVGWFFIDNWQISGIVDLIYSDVNGSKTTQFLGLIEPSVHIPINEKLFGFGGVGVGVGYTNSPNNQPGGAGFALVPRIGLNVLIGRSGILTPAFNLAYTTASAGQTAQGTVIAVNTSYGFSAGYTVMW